MAGRRIFAPWRTPKVWANWPHLQPLRGHYVWPLKSLCAAFVGCPGFWKAKVWSLTHPNTSMQARLELDILAQGTTGQWINKNKISLSQCVMIRTCFRLFPSNFLCSSALCFLMLLGLKRSWALWRLVQDINKSQDIIQYNQIVNDFLPNLLWYRKADHGFHGLSWPMHWEKKHPWPPKYWSIGKSIRVGHTNITWAHRLSIFILENTRDVSCSGHHPKPATGVLDLPKATIAKPTSICTLWEHQETPVQSWYILLVWLSTQNSLHALLK